VRILKHCPSLTKLINHDPEKNRGDYNNSVRTRSKPWLRRSIMTDDNRAVHNAFSGLSVAFINRSNWQLTDLTTALGGHPTSYIITPVPLLYGNQNHAFPPPFVVDGKITLKITNFEETI